MKKYKTIGKMPKSILFEGYKDINGEKCKIYARREFHSTCVMNENRIFQRSNDVIDWRNFQ
jgi:hypothetical protein